MNKIISFFVVVLLFGGAVAPSAAEYTQAEITKLRQVAEDDLGIITTSAQDSLGYAYDTGSGVTQDKREAVKWYRKAAERGYAPAQFYLAQAYSNGEGVAEDKREAVKWYRKAAEQGDADAQYNLGNAYHFGEGVTEDKREAVKWYRKAAEQGDASAQFNLGNAYNNGRGVTQDNREAVKWWRKAAEQGDAVAQFNLGVSYAFGEGVIQDEYEAYIWLSIAKVNGDEKAAEALELDWNSLLSRDEIKAAKREAAARLADIDARIAEAEADIDARIAEAITRLTDIGTNNDESDYATTESATVIPSPNTAARVFDSVWRSIVYIESGDGQGSGVIIGKNLVATNCHVIDGKRIAVFPPQTRQATADKGIVATIKTRDTKRDFCTLRVPGVGGVVATARRFATLKIGETVFALGAPKGLELTLSRGLISQLRNRSGKRAIQTDTAISPGSSGGGLFDSTGNLVGIMTSKITDERVEGIGFAIPADLVLGE